MSCCILFSESSCRGVKRQPIRLGNRENKPCYQPYGLFRLFCSSLIFLADREPESEGNLLSEASVFLCECLLRGISVPLLSCLFAALSRAFLSSPCPIRRPRETASGAVSSLVLARCCLHVLLLSLFLLTVPRSASFSPAMADVFLSSFFFR